MRSNEITTHDALMSMIQAVQAKVKTASICCVSLHDNNNDKAREEGMYSTGLQLEETFEQMELIQCYISEHYKE